MKHLILTTIVILTTFLNSHAQTPGPAETLQSRYLVIAVDGVGFDIVDEMYRDGELQNFLPPAPIINAFPSTTNPGLVEILAPMGAPASRGYEDVYYDPFSNKMRGSLFDRFSRKHFIETTFRGVFDYHPHQFRMTVEYAVPVLGPWINARVTMRRLKTKFQESDKPVFMAYVASSDLAIHLNGKWLLKNLMRRLDQIAGELRAETGQPVEVIIFSDHGNQVRKWKKAKLQKALRRANFKISHKLKGERSVVLPQYGLIASATLHTQPGKEADVAEALQHAEGVDLSVYRRGSRVIVVGRKGKATITQRTTPTGQRYRYQAGDGDPLQLKDILEDLRRRGALDAEGFASEENWLRATADHVYPDPLRRLWQGFDWVEQPASVLVSLDDGYYTGSWALDLFAILQATHGNLRQAQSRGVLLSTNPSLFLPDRGPFTGQTLLARITKAREGGATVVQLDLPPLPRQPELLPLP
jgi:hypothetical protein